MKLYLLRKRAGHTCAQAADVCLTSKQNWSNWELGSTRLSQGHAKLYAVSLGEDYDALASMTNEEVDAEIALIERAGRKNG